MPALKDPSFDPSQHLALAEIHLTQRQLLIWRLTHLHGWTVYQIRQEHHIAARTIERERDRALQIMEEAVVTQKEGNQPFRITLVIGGNAATRTDRTPLGMGIPCSFPDIGVPTEEQERAIRLRAA